MSALVCALSLCLGGCAANGDGLSPTNPGPDLGCVSHSAVTTPREHRPSPPAACTPQAMPGYCPPGSTGSCSSDGQCTAGLDGVCTLGANGCACQYDACLTDADCATGTDCACDANRGGAGASGSPTVCLTSACRLDSDCGPGGYCSPSYFAGGLGGCGTQWYGWFCHTPKDECGNASDCTGACGTGTSNACLYAKEVGYWKCAVYPTCAG